MVGKRHDTTRGEWNILQQALPSGQQGPRRLQHRRVMNGNFLVLRTGIPWRDLPERYGPCTTCCNRCSKNGDWSVILERLQSLMDGSDDQDGDGANDLQSRVIATRPNRLRTANPRNRNVAGADGAPRSIRSWMGMDSRRPWA